jgi:hypothetical protein
MADRITKLDGFVTLNDREVLNSAGKVSRELAVEHARGKFERYRQRESAAVESDFDRFSRRVLEEGPNDG